MYKLFTLNDNVIGACKIIDTAQVCFNFTDPANTDYQTFRKDVAGGVELQDADGNAMSAEDAKAFVATLP